VGIVNLRLHTPELAQLFLPAEVGLESLFKNSGASQTPRRRRSYNNAVHDSVQFADSQMKAIDKTPGEGQEECS
jgi:hypothetical protein